MIVVGVRNFVSSSIVVGRISIGLVRGEGFML